MFLKKVNYRRNQLLQNLQQFKMKYCQYSGRVFAYSINHGERLNTVIMLPTAVSDYLEMGLDIFRFYDKLSPERVQK